MRAWRLPAPLFFIVHSNISMTTSVPNSFNPEELAKMLKDAPKEAELGRDHSDRPVTYHDMSQETVERIASEAIDYASERSSGPMVHKVMAAMIISNMINWHSRMHGVILDDEDGCQNCALSWARDAGKLQAIMDILFEVNMGDDDFLTPND